MFYFYFTFYFILCFYFLFYFYLTFILLHFLFYFLFYFYFTFYFIFYFTFNFILFFTLFYFLFYFILFNLLCLTEISLLSSSSKTHPDVICKNNLKCMFYNLNALKVIHYFHPKTKYYKNFSCTNRTVLPSEQKR